MCYSAKVRQDYRSYVKKFGAGIDIDEFVKMFWRRQQGGKYVKVSRAMEAAFSEATTPAEQQIKVSIDEYYKKKREEMEAELTFQVARRDAAQAKLAVKVTKAAENDLRVSTNKIRDFKQKLEAMNSQAMLSEDGRMFPGTYVPVMIFENGRKLIRPMRYQCRLAGKPEEWDFKYPGTYNARMDSLDGYWKTVFGRRHGIVITQSFYEHVKRHRLENRALDAGENEEDVILSFVPDPPEDMLVACIWDHWTHPDKPDLFSFAIVTDDPPPEVARAGHDRCIIPIKPEHLDNWLNPDKNNLAAQYAILRDKHVAYYRHKEVARDAEDDEAS